MCDCNRVLIEKTTKEVKHYFGHYFSVPKLEDEGRVINEHYCTNCGELLEDSWCYCPSCGYTC